MANKSPEIQSIENIIMSDQIVDKASQKAKEKEQYVGQPTKVSIKTKNRGNKASRWSQMTTPQE